MKKLILAMLVLVSVLGICVYAAPVLDTAEAASEAVLAEESAEITLVKGVKPGLNMAGQTAGAWSFEEADGMNNINLFSANGKITENPLSDGVNSSASVYVESHKNAGFSGITYFLSNQMDGERPVYVSFKYYKSYTPAGTETGSIPDNLWVMKNGTQYKAKDINGFTIGTGWKQFSGLINFNAAWNAADQNDINNDPIKNIIIFAKMNSNEGYVNHYYDDISFVPSYKISYYVNDGTEEADPIAVKYALLDPAGKMLTKYYPDKTVVPERAGYDFLGWATTADATAPVKNIELKNEDLYLFAVWKEQPKKAGWDFETAESQTWGAAYARTYRNGMMILDSATQSSAYTNHSEVSFDTSVYKYLVFKARSVDSVDSIKFYFVTTTGNESEDRTVTVKLNPNSDVFTEYVIDMSSNTFWTGNYKRCMLQLNGGKGIVEFDDIYFTSDVEKRAAWTFEGSKQNGIRPWGHSVTSYVEDGNLVLVKDTVASGRNDGAVDLYPISYVKNDSYSVDATENPYVVVKALRGKGPESFQIYYITGAMTSITGSSYVNANKYGSDAAYDYYLADFSVKDGYADGFIKAFWLSAKSNGTYYIDEVYATDRKPSLENVVGWDFESGSASGTSYWGSYKSSFADGKIIVEQPTTGHGGINLAPSNIVAEENQYFVVKQVNAESVGKPGGFYPVGAYTTGINAALYMNYTTSYTTGDGVYTYYVYDLTKSDLNVNDGIAYTGKVGNCCITTSGKCVWEDMHFTNNLSNIIAECTIDKNVFTAPATSIATEGGSVKLSPFTSYGNGWILDYTYELNNDNAVIAEKTDGTAVLTAKYNGEVTITMTADNNPATVYTHTVAISGQAPHATVVYDANTTDEVTGMPESHIIQSWDCEGELSDANPVREGYTFLGWSDSGDYIYDKIGFVDGETVIMKAVWADYEYGLFRINQGEDFAGSVYINGNWTNYGNCTTNGGNVIVPLTDGVGYVLVGDSSDLESATVYKVTADACEELDYVPLETLAEKEARVTGDTGIRFKASVAHKMRNEGNVAEYGFAVSTSNQIDDGDVLDLSLVSSGSAVKGVAYSVAENIDKYSEENDEGIIMNAVITGVKADKKSYTTVIYVRPYMVLDSGLELYGLATSTTYYDVAKAIAINMPDDAPYASYINSIISIVEAE